MFTNVKVHLVLYLYLTVITVLTKAVKNSEYSNNYASAKNTFTRGATLLKNAAKNDQVYRCLNSLFYIVYGEEHALDFIKGQKPENYIDTPRAKEVAGKINVMGSQLQLAQVILVEQICQKRYPRSGLCYHCATEMVRHVSNELTQFAYLGLTKYTGAAKSLPKDCAQFKDLQLGKCEMLLNLLLKYPHFFTKSLVKQDAAESLELCNIKYDWNHIVQACRHKTGVDSRIFKHGEKDLDYLRKLQSDNICPGSSNLPY